MEHKCYQLMYHHVAFTLFNLEGGSYSPEFSHRAIVKFKKTQKWGNIAQVFWSGQWSPENLRPKRYYPPIDTKLLHCKQQTRMTETRTRKLFGIRYSAAIAFMMNALLGEYSSTCFMNKLDIACTNIGAQQKCHCSWLSTSHHVDDRLATRTFELVEHSTHHKWSVIAVETQMIEVVSESRQRFHVNADSMTASPRQSSSSTPSVPEMTLQLPKFNIMDL